VLLWVCIGLRLNAVLGGSVVHPIDGGYIIKVLQCPELVTAIVAGSCISVYVYSIMADAEGLRITTNTESSGNLSAKQCFVNGNTSVATTEYSSTNSSGWPYAVHHTNQMNHIAAPDTAAAQWQQQPTADVDSNGSVYTAHNHIATNHDSTASQSTQQNR
jgi:hypothetical protein